jgi:hypothetical protein
MVRKLLIALGALFVLLAALFGGALAVYLLDR